MLSTSLPFACFLRDKPLEDLGEQREVDLLRVGMVGLLPRVRDGDDTQAVAVALRQPLDRLEVDKRLLWEVLPAEDLAAALPHLDNVAGVDEGHRLSPWVGVDLQRALEVGAALLAPPPVTLLQFKPLTGHVGDALLSSACSSSRMRQSRERERAFVCCGRVRAGPYLSVNEDSRRASHLIGY